MHRSSFVVMLAVLVAVLAMTAAAVMAAVPGSGMIPAARAATSAGTGSISGLVTAKDSGTPLDGICVDLFLLSGSDPSNASAWFDVGTVYGTVNGDYSFLGLAAGTYELRLMGGSGACAQQYWNDKRTLTTADRIVLATGESRTVDVQLPKAGHIRGIVRNEAGEPLAGINVHTRAMNVFADDISQGSVFTAADGSYDIGGLNTGQYELTVVDMSEAETYLWQVFGGGHDQGHATPIAVTAGQATTQDVTMVPAATISGTMTTHLDLPIGDVQARAYTYKNGRLSIIGGAVRCADGSFTIGQLPAGRYLIGFTWSDSGYNETNPLFYPHTYDSSRATPVTVSEGEHVAGYDLEVWGDKNAPVTVAPLAAGAKKGRQTSLSYKVVDRGPRGPKAEVTLRIKDSSGRVVKTARLGWRRIGRLQTAKLLCNLPTGTYHFVVAAFDSGGNRQRKTGSNKLVVK